MAKKRGNNEGSLHKRRNGSWRAQVTIQGKRLNFTSKKKRECQDWIRQTLDEVNNGLTFEKSQVTLSEFMESWLQSAESSVRYNTITQYRQVTRQHILPALGSMKLRDVSPEHIQQLYNHKVELGLSLRTVYLIHSVIHRSLDHALKLGLLSRNPDDATTPPRHKPKEMNFLDESQVQQLLITAKANDDPFFGLYHLAISTGMRQGELLALKWTDLDWDQGSLQVQRQLTRIEAGGFGFTTPKTKAGNRNLDLGMLTLEALRQHNQQQFEKMASAGEKWQNQDLIFPTQIGTPYDRDNLRKQFKSLLRDAGLPRIRFHDLRHTAASLMLNNGIDVIVVSKRLGHSKPSITLDVYGHLIPGKQRQAAHLMDELLAPIQVQL